MLKIGVKRRRTKAQIEEDERLELEERERQQSALVELAQLRTQVNEYKHEADTNKVAAQIVSNMINAGAARQDSGATIVVQVGD